MPHVIVSRWACHFISFSLMALGWATLAAQADDAQRPNVLLILVDDLKPALGCYGDRFAQTPNIDQLAKSGLRFDLAYCNQAVCAPSRFTLMLGSHSTSTGLYGLGSHLRKVLPDAVTMPQYFAQHGYRTESLGKVFHIGHGNLGDPGSFSVPHFHDKVIEYLDPASTDGGKLTREEAYFTNQQLSRIRSLPRGAAFESPEVADEKYADGRVAAETVKRLRAAKQRRIESGTPFFIAAGFARPHLPFSAPTKYWNRFDPAKLPQPEFKDAPQDASSIGLKRGGEITNYSPVPPGGQVDAELTRQLIHGYYASTSFVDAQIGKVLKELKRLELDRNTIVVLWGDHGFHLGDHGFWTKHTNYEQANRIPILISAPGVTKRGTSTRQPAESVDIFPTIAELCGLPRPKGPQPIDGLSLVPVLKDPTARVRDHAYHAYPRRKLGRAIRTERYRLVEWRDAGESGKSEYELYDYQDDPLETRNLAAVKADVLKLLVQKLANYPAPVDPKRRARKAGAPTLRIAGKTLTIVAAFEAARPNGVVVAQGGREFGYAVSCAEGIIRFDVRIKGKVIRAASTEKYRGLIKVEARLTERFLILEVNGKPAAKVKSAGLIPVQPQDELSIGQDTLSAAGDYDAPFPFNGKIVSAKVSVGK